MLFFPTFVAGNNLNNKLDAIASRINCVDKPIKNEFCGTELIVIFSTRLCGVIHVDVTWCKLLIFASLDKFFFAYSKHPKYFPDLLVYFGYLLWVESNGKWLVSFPRA